MTTMSAADYRDMMERLGLDHAGMAQLLGVDVRSSLRYADGDRRIRGPAANFLRFIKASNLTANAVADKLSVQA